MSADPLSAAIEAAADALRSDFKGAPVHAWEDMARVAVEAAAPRMDYYVKAQRLIVETAELRERAEKAEAAYDRIETEYHATLVRLGQAEAEAERHRQACDSCCYGYAREVRVADQLAAVLRDPSPLAQDVHAALTAWGESRRG